MPGNVKAPAILVSAIANIAISSMIEEAAFLESSNFSAKWVTTWFFVTGFFDPGIFPPFE
jgi:hypothetical protein